MDATTTVTPKPGQSLMLLPAQIAPRKLTSYAARGLLALAYHDPIAALQVATGNDIETASALLVIGDVLLMQGDRQHAREAYRLANRWFRYNPTDGGLLGSVCACIGLALVATGCREPLNALAACDRARETLDGWFRDNNVSGITAIIETIAEYNLNQLETQCTNTPDSSSLLS